MKKKLKKYNKIVMHKLHMVHIRTHKLPRGLKYGLGSSFLAVGMVFFMIPTIPGWFLVILGIGVFIPGTYYKYIGRHFSTPTLKDMKELYSKELDLILNHKKKRSIRQYKEKVKRFLHKKKEFCIKLS